jgi:maltose/maltodextrin transport system permease protein
MTALRRLVPVVATLALLWGLMAVYASGQLLLAALLLALSALAGWIYTRQSGSAWAYLFPGLAAAAVFVIFPMAYTVGMGFSNYSARNLLDYERVRAQLLAESVEVAGERLPFALWPVEGGRLRLVLHTPDGRPLGWSEPLALTVPADPEGAMPRAVTLSEVPAGQGAVALPMPERVRLLPALRALRVTMPGFEAPLQLASLREMAPAKPLYAEAADGALQDTQTGTLYRPDARTGFFTSAEGETLQPGYRVWVGLDHYRRIFGEERFRAPFASVFAWTVAFAALTVMGTTALGLLVAVLLNWESLEGRAAYRLVLFLPYAVPSFISILIFKGLFNQNLGEINLILHGLFGVRPAWFTDPVLAKVMLLIVNIWLGFPYMTVLCTGMIKSIPADLYEASAVAGASPWVNFRRITLPLIIKPLTPLLISAFAFNFNNFVLISLLTGGRPDQIDTGLPAGTTDILVSYTWRIAFEDSGQQFGLAAALSTVIFVLVAAVTLVQMRLSRVVDSPAKEA